MTALRKGRWGGYARPSTEVAIPMPKLHSLLLLLPLAACQAGEGTRQAPPGEDFRKDTDVLITNLSNGETTSSPLVVQYEAGADVHAVQLDNQYGTLVASTVVGADGTGELIVELADDRYELTLVGLDDDGGELSRYTITVRVSTEDEASWVTITSPSDGQTVSNPVSFAVSSSADIDEIELFADDWSLGTVQPGGILTYEFSGTGYEREIVAQAFDDGTVVAEDGISITVQAGTEPVDSSFNQRVLEVALSYPTDGSYGYYWPSSGDWAGTTRDIWYRDVLVAEGDAQHRSYCSGITWETFMRAWTELDAETGGDGTINGMTVDDLYDFRTDWYVRELWGDGVGLAVENYGIGERVTDFADVQPGDYVQIWRHSGSGHTFVFIDWELDGDGDIIGVTYWSTQSSTDGIGYNTEYFGSSGSTIDPAYFFAARVYEPVDWLPWF